MVWLRLLVLPVAVQGQRAAVQVVAHPPLSRMGCQGTAAGGGVRLPVQAPLPIYGSTDRARGLHVCQAGW